MAQGAHLASLHSKEESDFVHSLCAPGDARGGVTCRIGLKHESGWSWTDGTAVDYWDPGLPPSSPTNPQCLVMARADDASTNVQTYVDTAGHDGEDTCTSSYHKTNYICKKDSIGMDLLAGWAGNANNNMIAKESFANYYSSIWKSTLHDENERF